MCISPVIIINPYFTKNTALGRYSLVHTPSLDFFYSRNPFDVFDYKRFPNPHKLKSSDLDDYYCVDVNSGDTIPLFIEVDCGKCSSCVLKRRKSWKYKMLLEQSCYDCPPIFLTLTYNNEHIPSDGVSIRDVQLFLKRFRSYVDYHYPGFSKFRYVCFSEYGKQHGRAHYHLLIFGVPLSSPRDILTLNNDLHTCWQNGFVYAKLCDHGCFNYVSKYVCKGSNVPPGKNPNFCLSSRRNGGIGVPAFDNPSVVYETLRSPHPVIKLKVLGRVFDVYIPKSVRERLFRSPRNIIPPRVVKQYNRFRYLGALLNALSQTDESVCDFVDHLCTLHSVKSPNDCLVIPAIFNKFESLELTKEKFVVPSYMLDNRFYSLQDVSSLFTEWLNLFKILSDFEIDLDFISDMYYLRSTILKRWQLSLVEFAVNNPEIDALSNTEFRAIIVDSNSSKDNQ